MAIKILKKGRLPEEIEYKFTCRCCSTVFVATELDGERVSDPRDGSYISVQCPTCGTSCSSSVEYKESGTSQYVYDVPPWFNSDRPMSPRFDSDRPPDFRDDPTGYY